MDVRQLKTFVVLAKQLNYQKAAKELQYAPSTLFNHIQLLEEELGISLFYKQGRQLCMTAEGERFLEHAYRILWHYEDAMKSLSGENVREEKLAISGCEVSLHYALMGAFKEFVNEHPHINVSMFMGPNSDVPCTVRNSSADVGFFHCVGRGDYPGLETTYLYQEPVYLAVSRAHPLACRKQLTYQDLRGQCLVHTHQTGCILRALEDQGAQFAERTFLGCVHLVCERVCHTDGVTLFAERAFQNVSREYDLVPLDMAEKPITAWMTMLCRNGEVLEPVVHELMRHIKIWARRRESFEERE